MQQQTTTFSGTRLEIASKSEVIAIQEVDLQMVSHKQKKEKKERHNRIADLLLAKEELLVKSCHKVKRAKEPNKLSKKPVYQNSEQERREKDLTIAYRNLTLQCKYLKQFSSKLRAANRALIEENKNKEKLAQDFFLVHNELLKAQSNQKAYIAGLSGVMDVVSHKLRQPVVQIMGLTSLLSREDAFTDTIDMIALIKESADNLDCYSRELTELIHIQEMLATQLVPTLTIK